MKILSLVGARPQFIKEAAVYEKLKESGVEEVLVHSEQHYFKSKTYKNHGLKPENYIAIKYLPVSN